MNSPWCPTQLFSSSLSETDNLSDLVKIRVYLEYAQIPKHESQPLSLSYKMPGCIDRF